MGVQFGTYPDAQGTPDANFGAAVDGNYGFGDGCFDGDLDATRSVRARLRRRRASRPSPADDYLVHVENSRRRSSATRSTSSPAKRTSTSATATASSRRCRRRPAPARSTRSTSPTSATDDYPATTIPDPSDTAVRTSTSPRRSRREPDLRRHRRLALRGPGHAAVRHEARHAPERQVGRPDVQRLHRRPAAGSLLRPASSTTSTSRPTRSPCSSARRPGVPFAPVGIYDYANRLVTTVESDYNGLFDVLLPSTNRINCPTPSGVCANLYRFVGNDPGIPGRLNPNYNPQFRTIAAEFEAMPGLIIPADNAPTQVGVSIQLPGSQQNRPSAARSTTPASRRRPPELYAVSKPYTTGPGQPFTITGQGFGATKGTGQVTLDGVACRPPRGPTARSWSRPASATVDRQGPHQLAVTADNGRTTVNGLTFHRPRHRTSSTRTTLRGRPDATTRANYSAAGASVTLPAALRQLTADAEHALPGDARQAYADPGRARPRPRRRGAPRGRLPGTPQRPTRGQNPRGAYYENLDHRRPGEAPGRRARRHLPGRHAVTGSIVDGSAFGGDTALADAWRDRMASLTWVGNQAVFEGPVDRRSCPDHGGNASRRRSAPTRPADRRLRHPRRRPVGLPEQHQRDRRRPDRLRPTA